MIHRSCAVVLLLALTQLAACSGLRPASSARTAHSGGTPPPAASENPASSPPSSSTADSEGAQTPAGTGQGASPPAGNSEGTSPSATTPPATAANQDQGSQPPGDAAPACVPPAPKAPTKPKPKPVARQAPPSTTPAEPRPASGGGVVNADVRPVSEPVMSILGKRVDGAKGEDLGRVVDVLADAQGRVRVAIIDFGGFLGVGDRRIAVDWPLLRFEPGRNPVVLVSEDQLKSAPEFKDGARPQTLMVPAAAEPVPTAGIAAAGDSKK